MPQPTGVRVFHRQFNLAGLTKKPTRSDLDLEKRDRTRRPDLTTLHPSHPAMDKLTAKDVRKTLHLPGRSSSPAKRSPKASPRLAPTKAASLSVEIESPPLIFHGTPAQSSGALLSGMLLLTATDPEVRIHSYTMSLNAKVTTKKPVSKDCPDCITKISEIHAWNFLSEPTSFKQGTHRFPFSYLLKGNLPATSVGEMGRMEYLLSAQAKTEMGEHLRLEFPLNVQRALMPGPDRNSERIFPPTNLRALVVTPSVIHPIGTFPVQLRLSGLAEAPSKEVQKRWRIRKIGWRIDEQSSIVSAACHTHAHKVGGEGKGIYHETTRAIGGKDFTTGWKTDFDTPGGMAEIEFTACIDASKRAICDVEASNGLSASHALWLEVIVGEEQIAMRGNRYPTPTGGARVLRMQFKTVLTQRAGMGISWDEEMPPMYEDVPRSPPGYNKIEDFEGDLDEEFPLSGEQERDSILHAGPSQRSNSPPPRFST